MIPSVTAGVEAMTADRVTGIGDGIVGSSGNDIGIEINQMGIVLQGSGNPVGVMTGRTGGALAIDMFLVKARRRQENIWIMTLPTEGIIPLYIGKGVWAGFVPFDQNIRINRPMRTICPQVSRLGTTITVMTIGTIDKAGNRIFRPQAGNVRVVSNGRYRVI
jgi:hypothetical protein